MVIHTEVSVGDRHTCQAKRGNASEKYESRRFSLCVMYVTICSMAIVLRVGCMGGIYCCMYRKPHQVEFLCG